MYKTYKAIIIPGMILIGLILSGTLSYHFIEGWRYVDSLYFTVMTMTTIGYGDFSPETDFGKIFTVAFAFLGIGIMFYFFTLVGRYFMILQRKEELESNGKVKKSYGIKRV